MNKTKSERHLLNYVEAISKRPEAFGINKSGELSLPWLMPSIISKFADEYLDYQNVTEFESIMTLINRHANEINDDGKRKVLDILIEKKTFISDELWFVMNFGNAIEQKIVMEKTLENNTCINAIEQIAEIIKSSSDVDMIFEIMTSKIKNMNLEEIKSADSTLIKILQAFSKNSEDPRYYSLARDFAMAKTGFNDSCFFIHRLIEYEIPVDIEKIVNDIISVRSANVFDVLRKTAIQILKPESTDEDMDVLGNGRRRGNFEQLKREDALVVNMPFPEVGKMILESIILHIVKKKNRTPYSNMKDLLETLNTLAPLGIEKIREETDAFISRQIKIAKDQTGESFLYSIHLIPPMLKYLSKELTEKLNDVLATSISLNAQGSVELVSKNIDLMLYLKASPSQFMTFTNEFTNHFIKINETSTDWINSRINIPGIETGIIDEKNIMVCVENHAFYKDEIKHMNYFDKFAVYKFSSDIGFWNMLKLMTTYSKMSDSESKKFIKDRFIDIANISIEGKIKSKDVYRSLSFSMPEFLANDIEIKRKMLALSALSTFDDSIANNYNAPFAPSFMHYLDFLDKHIIPNAKSKYTDWVNEHSSENTHPINGFFEGVLGIGGATAVLSAMEINPKTKEGRLIMCHMLNQQFDGILKHDTSIEKVNVDTSVGIDLANI